MTQRRTTALATAALLVIALAPSAIAGAAANAASTGWPQYQGGAGHANESSQRAINASTVVKMTAGWTARNIHGTRLEPVVSHHRVFTVVDGTAKHGERLQARSAATGRLLWSRTMPLRYETPYAPPVVTNGDVVITLSAGPGATKVRALSAANGATVWTWRDNVDDHTSDFNSLTAGDGVLVGQLAVSGADVALDARTGRKLWVLGNDTGTGYYPTFGGGSVFVSGPSGPVALDPRTGATKWSVDDDQFDGGTFAVASGRLLLSGMSSGAAFPAKGCGQATCSQPLWVTTWAKPQQHTMVSAADSHRVVYFDDPAYGSKPGLYVVSARTGAHEWHTRLTGRGNAALSLGYFVRTANILLAAGTKQIWAFPVHCHDGCNPIARLRIPDDEEDKDSVNVTSPPVVADRHIYVTLDLEGVRTLRLPGRGTH
jgi:outer membrane protein assembly factor BamB